MKKYVATLPASLLRDYFAYNAETGDLIWKTCSSPSLKRLIGTVAGFKIGGRTPCIEISLMGMRIKAHRAVWIWHHGDITSDVIDHRDGNRFNNRIENLRQATFFQNSANKVTGRKSIVGYKGTYFCADKGYWQAQIRVDGKRHHLGSFKTEAEAAEAYRVKALSCLGEFARFA